MNLASVGISITTRNRWGEVEKTLSMIELRPELADCPIIVIDDGSENPVPKTLVERHFRVRFLSSPRSLGASAQRTRIARLLTTEFILQLDDDSYPVDGSMTEAAAFLASRPDLLALALNIVTRGEASPPFERSHAPYAVDRFIGCGVLFAGKCFWKWGDISAP